MLAQDGAAGGVLGKRPPKSPSPFRDDTLLCRRLKPALTIQMTRTQDSAALRPGLNAQPPLRGSVNSNSELMPGKS